jgi:hypothetical protein
VTVCNLFRARSAASTPGGSDVPQDSRIDVHKKVLMVVVVDASDPFFMCAKGGEVALRPVIFLLPTLSNEASLWVPRRS